MKVSAGRQSAVIDLHQHSDLLDLTAGQARSRLSLPLIHEGRVLGVLTLESVQEDAFSAADQSFIGQLATQAAIAVVNANLLSDVSRGRDHLAAVLDSVDEGILMVGADGDINLANEALRDITGLVVNEVLGKRFDQLEEVKLACLGLSLQEAQELQMSFMHGQMPNIPKKTLTLGEGPSERVVDRFSFPVWGSEGNLIGWMIVLRDVTEEHRLNQARELITETLVHDLRSPVSVVLGALDVMDELFQQERDLDPSLVTQATRIARRGAMRVLGLVENLLDLARFRSGKMELTLNDVDLREMCTEILNEFAPQSQEFGIILRNQVPEVMPNVRVDRSKITRVLVNLVDNAVKFTPSSGQIVLSAEIAPEGMIAVRVSDSGPGVPPEFRDKVFERFSQVPGQRGRRRGSGLGLTYCRLAVEAHGGRIWVAERRGGGSDFVFTLPATSD